jgi:hypothetical protein
VAFHSADESFSPEPIREIQEAEDEAGSFSPQLLHDDENEEAIDPEEDKAILVIFLNTIIKFNGDPCLYYEYINYNFTMLVHIGAETYGCNRRAAKTSSGSNGIKASSI